MLLEKEKGEEKNNIWKPIQRTKAWVFPRGGIEEEKKKEDEWKNESGETGFYRGVFFFASVN